MKDSKVMVITGNTIDEVRQSANRVIQQLANEISVLTSKLSNVAGESGKVNNNGLKIVSNKENVYLETSNSSGKYSIKLERKE